MSRVDDLNEAQRAYLLKMRERLGFSQTAMANLVGMSIRAYSDIETGVSKCRKIHINAAERVVFRIAAARNDPSLLTGPLRNELKALQASPVE